MLLHIVFGGLAAARRQKLFSGVIPPCPDIPSPLHAFRQVVRTLKARKEEAQAEQARFQEHLQALGITRLERMTCREVLESYTPKLR